MRFVSTLVAVAALFCMGASAPGAMTRTQPRATANAVAGWWQVVVRITYADGSVDLGFWRWFGLADSIDPTTCRTLVLVPGVGYAPESAWRLVGARIEIVSEPGQCVGP